MVLIPFINIVDWWICLKIFLVVNKEIRHWKYIYRHGTGKASRFLKRLLQWVLVCAPTIILMIFFCKVNIFLLLEQFLCKIVQYCIKGGSIQNKLTSVWQCRWYQTQIELHNMLHLIWGSFEQYGPSSLDGFHIASQKFCICCSFYVCMYVSL